MKRLPKFYVFAKKFTIFFLISHIASYAISSIQTYWIVKEVRKAGGNAK